MKESMNLKQTKYLLLLSAILLSMDACQKAEENNDLRTIHLEDIEYGNEKLALSECVDSLQYIFLESKEASYFGKIDKLIMSETRILVWDNTLNKILLFSNNGEFICQVSKKGKGPSEYVDIGDVTLNEDENRILLKCDDKIVVFDLNGVFTGTYKVDLFLHYIHDFGESIGGVTLYPISQWSDNYSFHFLDQAGNVIGKDGYRSIPKLHQAAIAGFNSSYCYKDTLCYWECYYDTIFGLTGKNEVVPRWKIKKGDWSMNFNDYLFDESYKKKREDGKLSIVRILETNKYFMFDVIGKGVRKNIIYDKSSEISIEQGNFNSRDLIGFEDDIDGLFNCWPTDALNTNTLYYYENVYYLKDLLKKKGKENQEISEKGKAVKKKILSLSDMHNPIIILIHFRHD